MKFDIKAHLRSVYAAKAKYHRRRLTLEQRMLITEQMYFTTKAIKAELAKNGV